ncbi:MAG TPA: isochorismatase family protein [Polyangiaceae bacterium]|nr:isochorismatase family protein [Polyangiaceae bacterium]
MRYYVTIVRTRESLMLEQDRVAIVVIDVQEKLLPHIWEFERVVSNIALLIRFAKLVGIPVLWTEQEKLGPTAASIASQLSESRPVVKSAFGAFGSPDFCAQLEAIGRTELAIVGIEAHICVLQTALLAPANYELFVIRDAVSSRSRSNVDAALARLAELGVATSSTEMFIYEVLRRSGTDVFRRALALVKELQ